MYQKLYKYLDSALPARARRNIRPPGASGLDSLPASSPAKPSTPAKQAHIRPDKAPQRKPLQRLAGGSSEVPKWIMPAIRRLCEKMEAPEAPHHIFAGVSSILAAQEMAYKTNPKAPVKAIKTPALIIALFMLATTRLSGAEMVASEYQRQRGQGSEILNELAKVESEVEDVENRDVDACLRQIREQGWTCMDWFENIPAGAGLGISNDTEAVEDRQDQDEGGQLLPVTRRDDGVLGLAEPDYLQPGLGTMVQKSFPSYPSLVS